MESDILTYEKRYKVDIRIEILGCYVNRLDFKRQAFEDQIILTGTQHELPFLEFEQVPLCNYTSWYTVTMQPKINAEMGI